MLLSFLSVYMVYSASTSSISRFLFSTENIRLLPYITSSPPDDLVIAPFGSVPIPAPLFSYGSAHKTPYTHPDGSIHTASRIYSRYILPHCTLLPHFYLPHNPYPVLKDICFRRLHHLSSAFCFTDSILSKATSACYLLNISFINLGNNCNISLDAYLFESIGKLAYATWHNLYFL